MPDKGPASSGVCPMISQNLMAKYARYDKKIVLTLKLTRN